MLKGAFFVAAGALAVAVFATAVTGPEAMAAAPKCKNKANKYVACTDKLRTKTGQKAAKDKQLDVDSYSFGDGSASKQPRLAK